MQPWQQRAWMSLFSPIWRALILTTQTLKRSWKEHRSIRRDKYPNDIVPQSLSKDWPTWKKWLITFDWTLRFLFNRNRNDGSFIELTGNRTHTWNNCFATKPFSIRHETTAQPPVTNWWTSSTIQYLIKDIIPLQHLGTFSPFPC